MPRKNKKLKIKKERERERERERDLRANMSFYNTDIFRESHKKERNKRIRPMFV